MRRSTMRVLLTRAGGLAPPGYFKYRAGGERVETAIRPPLIPAPRDRASLAAKAAAVLATVHLAGCATVLPDYVTAGAVHQSHPGAGPYDWPVGDRDRTPETTYDGLEAGARWERGRAYGEATMAYAFRYSYMEGGPWVFTVRAGIRVRLDGSKTPARQVNSSHNPEGGYRPACGDLPGMVGDDC